MKYRFVRVILLLVAEAAIGAARQSTTIALIPAPDPVTFGEPIVLTANINSTLATGKVTFYDGATVLGTAAVSAGHAALQVSLNVTGARRLYARYGGDANFVGSTSPVVVQNVHSAPSFGFTSTSTVMHSSTVNCYTGYTDIVLATGDFNGDGKADLVGFCEAVGGGTIIGVMLGNGDGTFGAPMATAGPILGGSVLSVSDFDGDGKLDVAAGGSVLFGNGDGTFGGAVTLTTGSGPFTVADFNGDGVPDIAVIQTYTNSLSVFLGNGNRTFAAPIEYPFAAADLGSLAAGDLNGDGNPDLLTVVSGAENQRYLVVLLGNGDGTFETPLSLPLNIGPFEQGDLFALEDMNGDGKLDLVFAPGLDTSSSR